MKNINRRDFLKLSGALSAGAILGKGYAIADSLLHGSNSQPNIVILLMDTMTANHLSLYGYERPTTPNLSRLANRATVFHSHFSAGNFTTPGTASMLTGSYPWRHRAINQRGLINKDFVQQNIFSSIGNDYYRIAYSQNLWADLFLGQFRGNIEQRLPPDTFSLKNRTFLMGQMLPRDHVVGYHALDDFMAAGHPELNRISGSLSLGISEILLRKQVDEELVSGKNSPLPPLNFYFYFELEKVFNGITSSLTDLAKDDRPFFAYYHVFPPHEPYRPIDPFSQYFNADIDVRFKPRHKLANSHYSFKKLQEFRRSYDQYIANVDFELGKALENLSAKGILDNTYVILTSDHGHLFERGEHGHGSPLLYDSVIHIPLVIFSPGQSQRRDIYTPTSNVDILPTLCHIAGQPIEHATVDGKLLPAFGGDPDSSRSIFSLAAKTNSAFLPLTKCTVSMIKGSSKLIYYAGYDGYKGTFELYDLDVDSEEIENLIERDISTFTMMKEEMLDTFNDANRAFVKY